MDECAGDGVNHSWEVMAMTKYREILRLWDQGISKSSIAKSCECSRNTVSSVISRAEEAKMRWPSRRRLHADPCQLHAEYPQITRWKKS